MVFVFLLAVLLLFLLLRFLVAVRIIAAARKQRRAATVGLDAVRRGIVSVFWRRAVPAHLQDKFQAGRPVEAEGFFSGFTLFAFRFVFFVLF
uniref:Putative salivary secreted peptide n=1 Tax=Anopheles darlingi TaxID=43151 RepID=A0A2M4DNN8_ANODA